MKNSIPMYLLDHIDLDPENENEKIILDILQEAYHDDGTGKRPAKWIDEIPDTQPKPPVDVEPTLKPEVLLYDVEQANEHWATFQKRCPQLAKILNKMGYTPSITKLPEDDVEGYRMGLHEWFATVDRMNDCRKPSKKQIQYFVEGVGNRLLIIDYFNARGGEHGKDVSFKYVYAARRTPSFVGQYGFEEFAEPLEVAIMNELYWPFVSKERMKKNFLTAQIVTGALPKSSKRNFRAHKWSLSNFVSLGGTTRQQTIMPIFILNNAYVEHEDSGGLIVLRYMFHDDPKDLFQGGIMQRAFIDRFGKDKGEKEFQRFSEAKNKLRKRS